MHVTVHDSFRTEMNGYVSFDMHAYASAGMTLSVLVNHEWDHHSKADSLCMFPH